jgi:hypothetical protein
MNAQVRAESGMRLSSALRRAGSTLLGILREIFDESAYERFLARNGMVSSRGAYAQFLREGQAARDRRPRCC